MPQPKVYIIHELQKRDLSTGAFVAQHDFTPAEKFGELVHVVIGNITPSRYDDALEVIQDKLAAYTADDYLLFVGDPALIAMAAAVAVRATGGPIRWLTWDNRGTCYTSHPPLDFYNDAEKEMPANG